jgi:DNA-binding transcriptional LysR family regulator
MREEHFTGLATLLAVADKKSFTAAASALGVTPSAVSQAVKQLEARAGVRLLQRTTRSVGLTEAGAQLVARLRPAMSEVVSALENLGELQEEATGTLRLNVSRVGCALIIEPMLASFMTAYPLLSVELVIDDALTNLVDGGFDAGLRLGERLDKGMVGVKVGGDLSLAVVGSPGYFKAHKVPKHPLELQAHDCIRFRRMPSGVLYKWEFEEGGREVEVSTSGRLIVNDSLVLINAARQGLGLAQVFTQAVAGEMACGRLVRVLEKFSAPFPGFYLYYPSRERLPLKLKVFVDFVRHYFTPKPRLARR